MDRIESVDGLFHEGNSSIGQKGTKVTAAWLNSLQAEIVNVIETCGLALDPAQSDQLVKALRSGLFSDVVYASRYPTLAEADAAAVAAGKQLVISTPWNVVPAQLLAETDFVKGGNLTASTIFGPGTIVCVDVRRCGTITYGTAANAAQQTANAAALQLAVTIARLSQVPVVLPAGTILINEEVVSPTVVKIIGQGVLSTRILQTAAGKSIFVLGITNVYTFGWGMVGMQLATAAASYDCVQLLAAASGFFQGVLISGAGRYGWNIGGVSASQELLFVDCPVNGYFEKITGQNTNGSNGHFIDAFHITNCTTIKLDGVSVSLGENALYANTSDLKLTWYGTAQGQTGKVISMAGGAMDGFDINLHTEGTAGGLFLKGAKNGQVRLRNTDVGGADLDNCNNVKLMGMINQVNVAENCYGIVGENIAYGGQSGKINDLALDSKWINCSATGGIYFYGIKDNDPLTSIFPNTNLERWTSNTAPNGLGVWGGATITKCGTGLGDTTKNAGSFSAKILGASESSGLMYSVGTSDIQGKYVAARCLYKLATDTDSGALEFQLNGGAQAHTIPFSATLAAGWHKMQASLYIPAGTTGVRVIFKAGNGKTIYLDEVDILVNGYTPNITMEFTPNTAMPDISYGSHPVTFWKTANTAPTNYTYFVGGYSGLEYTIQIKDANSILVHGARLKLRGGANKSGVGTIIKLIYDSEADIWYQSAYESV